MAVLRPRPAPGVQHFGEFISGRHPHRVTRATYGSPNRSPHSRMRRERVSEDFWNDVAWAYRDEEHSRHSDAYLLIQRDAALRNFDLSMAHFQTLDACEFEGALENVLAKGRTFKPVESLSDWHEVEGAYVMVFDEYRQFYVGQASDIRKRIKQHWTRRKSFDRLIFGTTYNSILPVDELGALDTTRIYAARSMDRFTVEQRAEGAADQRFCLNRMGGGMPSPLLLMLTAASPRSRDLGVRAVPMAFEDYALAWDEVTDIIASTRAAPDVDAVGALAGLDMAINAVAREDGTQFMWSRRDTVAASAARGRLSVAEFVAFLEAMGETVIWPEE